MQTYVRLISGAALHRGPSGGVVRDWLSSCSEEESVLVSPNTEGAVRQLVPLLRCSPEAHSEASR
jgi:hypothetical protein